MSEFRGHLTLRAAARPDGRSVLAAQSFRAPFHVSKPYWDSDARVLLAQVVNPTAGILAGDYLESRVAVDAGAALLITTPSASRVFCMRQGTAECHQHFAVAEHGWLEISPEPLVPHAGARFRQVTRIDVAAGGGLFFVDQLLPGRVGHGEAWQWDRLRVETEVRAGGELVLRERLDQSGDELRALAELGGSGPTACFVNALLVAAETEMNPTANWRAELSALHGDGLWLGVSELRRGGWSIKCVARDTVRLRATLAEIRRVLATSFPRLACNLRKL